MQDVFCQRVEYFNEFESILYVNSFRLKVDHSILEDEPTTRSPYADYNYGLDYRKKRALPGVGGYLTTVPRHSLKICYR